MSIVNKFIQEVRKDSNRAVKGQVYEGRLVVKKNFGEKFFWTVFDMRRK